MRVLVVAGLEGTGHHALAAMLSVCMSGASGAAQEAGQGQGQRAKAGGGACKTDPALDQLLTFTHHNAKTRLGLFQVEDSARAGKLVGALEAGFRNVTQREEVGRVQF